MFSRICFSIRHFTLGTPRSKGFTLIEVLLAMTILVVILTVVYASFSTSSRNIEQAEQSRDETDVARTFLNRLCDDIANTYVDSKMNSVVNPPEVMTIFYGKKEEIETGDRKTRHDSITLTRLTDPLSRTKDSKETDIWEVGFSFKEKPEGKGFVVMRREKRELSRDKPALQGGAEYEITDQVENLQFRYSSDGGKTWVDEWDTRKGNPVKLPNIVEIAITLDSGKVYTTKVDVTYKPS